ncbi:unnamed protein product, partial [Mesorhabditis belari]|uniref:Acetyl-coenzyme A synthetase n=1 Tax=Mesorhabditis belari TaxID=2138241 RepID=A0AAF3E9G8_9BILA
MSDAHVKFNLGNPVEDSEEEVFLPPAPLLAGAHVAGLPSYHEMYSDSINNSDAFWKKIAQELHFFEPSNNGLEYNFDSRKGPIFTRFMAGAKTNISYNCLERNIQRGYGDRVAYLWEGNEPCDSNTITYNQLHEQVLNFSAVLRAHGVKKGDVVAIYLPMVLELAVAMLACARIGALHSVVFAGFSADSLASRIVDAKCKILITADGFFRGPKAVILKPIVDKAIEISKEQGVNVESAIIVEHLNRATAPNGHPAPTVDCSKGIYHKYFSEMQKYKGVDSPVEWMDAEDPLFILYTSGSTGKPKGILHTTAGYMTYVYATCKYNFDLHHENEKDIYWCTADCGWITGHSYLLYGPLMNGVSSVFFEGVPSYPDASRLWAVTEKYKVTKLYTSPTAIRALMAFGDQFVTKHDRSTLSILGTVGEPINPAAWRWLHKVVGEARCSIVDTYWQTETGGHMIVPLPGATPQKPGSATLPFFGVNAVLLDAEGRVIEGPGEGNLCFGKAWPGMMRNVYGDYERFVKTYMQPFPGYYFTGDGARRDDDGYIWITGRVDDLMNVSGHLLSTAEIEGALTQHPKVAEAAVVSAPHDIKGSYPYAFVTLKNGERLSKELIVELKQIVREKIGAIAQPDVIQEAPGLPKTRSGKVTRRILRKIAEGCDSGLGDTTTLVDETVIQQLISGRDNRA